MQLSVGARHANDLWVLQSVTSMPHGSPLQSSLLRHAAGTHSFAPDSPHRHAVPVAQSASAVHVATHVVVLPPRASLKNLTTHTLPAPHAA